MRPGFLALAPDVAQSLHGLVGRRTAGRFWPARRDWRWMGTGKLDNDDPD